MEKGSSSEILPLSWFIKCLLIVVGRGGTVELPPVPMIYSLSAAFVISERKA
jgi:hypothetical protein